MNLLTRLKAWIHPSTEKLLADFNSLAAKLHIRAKLHDAQANFHSDLADAHAAAVNVENAAAQKARSVANKIQALVS